MDAVIKILLVEDNPVGARLLEETPGKADTDSFELSHVKRLSEAFDHLEQKRVDVILLDLALPDAEWLEAVTRLHAAARNVAIVVLTDSEDEALAVKALQEGAQDYLVKGQIERSLLVRAIRYGIARKRAEAEQEQLVLQLEEALQRAKTQMKRVTGLLPMCATCKSIRDDKGYWNQIEAYLREHCEASFSHSICPECAKILYPKLAARGKIKKRSA